MVHPQKSERPAGRGERHSAAWGKRLSLVLLLATGMAFGQRWNNRTVSEVPRTESSRIAPELGRLLAQARQGSAHGQTVKVIVQYRHVPTAAHYAAMQDRGGRLHVKLHMIKSAAFTIPVSALPALEADPEIASVSIDHPLKGMDDYTDTAMNVSAAWNSGYDGTGIGVAVIDSGINDNHRTCGIQHKPIRAWSITKTSPALPPTTLTIIWFTISTDMARTWQASSVETATGPMDSTPAWRRM